MEILLLILLLVLVLIVLNTVRSQADQVERLSHRTQFLIEEVARLRSQRGPEPPAQVVPPKTETPIPPRPLTRPMPQRPPQAAAEPPRLHEAPPPEAVEPEPMPQPKRQRALPWESWWNNNPDLEKFIGENLVNKIGIAVLVLGIAFFVKYAIDKDWIGEAGRVAIGFGCGALLVGLAHFLRRSYTAFSSVLAGGGIAVFYFTVAFAFHQYGLLSQTTAFVLMVGITGFAVLLALLYNQLALAVIAAVGGFLTPFLVSTGEGNYVVLLSYLCILNAGLLALAWFKRWPVVNILALVFTLLIVGGWIVRDVWIEEDPRIRYGLALALVTVLYGLFLGMNMVHGIRRRTPFRRLDFSLLLALTAAYYAAGMTLLAAVEGGRYQGLFTIGTGAVNLALALYCYRRGGTDRNLLYLLIGLTLTFGALAVPVQLEGHAITLFWSAEFVLLYWLFQRSGIGLFRTASRVLTGLTLLSLFLDWQAANSDPGLVLLYRDTRGLVTNLVVTAAFFAYAALRARETPKDEAGFDLRATERAALAIGCTLLYLTALFGVNLYFYKLTAYAVPNVYHRIVTAVFVLLLGIILKWRRARWTTPVTLALTGGATLFYLGSFFNIVAFRELLAGDPGARGHYYAQLAATAFYIAMLLRAALLVKRESAPLRAHLTGLAWAFAAAFVLFGSIDGSVHYGFVLQAPSRPLPYLLGQYGRAGLTILWGCCSFVLMWLGMRHRNKTLRVASLSLFSLALLKLFGFDLRGLSEGARIAAFILLGVLLLTVSFMYQKLKKLLIDDRAV
ncbi:DUF2339 domain-containing protein [Flaviaesturariibacter amylovorans]|uniref:DUF2339 domain-containing protein n=1 Tax=Flaviaesturariibacter amylovorans TaxID=1084520 RepID=A0ABP8G5B9_9BACT